MNSIVCPNCKAKNKSGTMVPRNCKRCKGKPVECTCGTAPGAHYCVMHGVYTGGLRRSGRVRRFKWVIVDGREVSGIHIGQRQVFRIEDIINPLEFTYLELISDIEGCLAKVGLVFEDATDDELIELYVYMTRFIKDVEEDFESIKEKVDEQTSWF